MNQDFKPITDMDLNDNWLRRVQKGSPIFLVKENTFAYVEWEYDPRTTGYCGHIGLRFENGRQDSWYIQGNGTGIDGSQCLYPVQGFLLEKETELPPKYLDDLTRRVQKLEDIILNRPCRFSVLNIDEVQNGRLAQNEIDRINKVLADIDEGDPEEDIHHLRRILT